jgi:hypothetical protein
MKILNIFYIFTEHSARGLRIELIPYHCLLRLLYVSLAKRVLNLHLLNTLRY